LRIRSARSDDLKQCLTLDAAYETDMAWQVEELNNDGGWGMRFREIRLPRKQTVRPPFFTPEDRLRAWQRRDGFWVAAERNHVWGYLALVLEIEHKQARVTDLVVAPDYRRQGVGTQLLQHAMTWCLRQEMDQLLLECSLKAYPAVAFAQKQGFVICGFQDAYWPGREVGLFFRKRIR